jgi:hypothetical protein
LTVERHKKEGKMADDGVSVFIAADDGTLSGTKDEREAKLAERRLFEIDQYYHLIEPYTFKTVFIDISGTFQSTTLFCFYFFTTNAHLLFHISLFINTRCIFKLMKRV